MCPIKGQAWENYMQIKTNKGKICSGGICSEKSWTSYAKGKLKPGVLDFSTIFKNYSSNSITYFKGDLKIYYAGGCLEEIEDIWVKVASLALFFMKLYTLFHFIFHFL